MPITIRWDSPQQTITRLDFQGYFTLNDLFDAWQQELDMMRKVSHPVYSLNIFHTIPFVSKGFQVSKLRGFIQANQADNLVMTVQVAESAMLRGFLVTLAKTMPHTIHVLATESEAYDLIKKHQTHHFSTGT